MQPLHLRLQGNGSGPRGPRIDGQPLHRCLKDADPGMLLLLRIDGCIEICTQCGRRDDRCGLGDGSIIVRLQCQCIG